MIGSTPYDRIAHARWWREHLRERCALNAVDELPPPVVRVFIADIQAKVARFYGIPQAEMVSDRKARDVAHPRQVAMYLCKQLTIRSLPEIGRQFGGRDHSTIMHGVREVERRRAADPELNRDIALLRAALTGDA